MRARNSPEVSDSLERARRTLAEIRAREQLDAQADAEHRAAEFGRWHTATRYGAGRLRRLSRSATAERFNGQRPLDADERRMNEKAASLEYPVVVRVVRSGRGDGPVRRRAHLKVARIASHPAATPRRPVGDPRSSGRHKQFQMPNRASGYLRIDQQCPGGAGVRVLAASLSPSG